MWDNKVRPLKQHSFPPLTLEVSQNIGSIIIAVTIIIVHAKAERKAVLRTQAVELSNPTFWIIILMYRVRT